MPNILAGSGRIGSANERAARRAQYRHNILARAEAEALRVGRSIKCGEYGHHAGDTAYDGCKNDGSTCLCECHDPKRAGI